jgi:hypothetical protein
MDRDKRPPDDEPDDEDDVTEAVVAADDTGLVRNEIQIVHAEFEQADEGG